MNGITWLSHGGPGSGRYPKGSGKNPRGLLKRLRERGRYKKEQKEKTKTETETETKPKTDSSEENAKSDKQPSSAEFLKAANSARQVSTGIDNISKGVDKAWNSLHNAKYSGEDRSKNVRGLTNEELRKTIERIELDQKYNKITMPSKSKGYDRTMAALAILGSIATVTATGISIASGIQSLRKK